LTAEAHYSMMKQPFAVDGGGEMVKKQKELTPEIKEDEIDEIVKEFLREEIAKEAEQAAKREEKRGE